MWVLFLIFLIIFEIIADIFAKQFSITGKISDWMLAIGGYITANTFWLFAIRNGSGLARGAVLFSVCSAVLAIIIGVVFYREKVEKVEMVGLIFGVITTILLLWHEIKKIFD